MYLPVQSDGVKGKIIINSVFLLRILSFPVQSKMIQLPSYILVGVFVFVWNEFRLIHVNIYLASVVTKQWVLIRAH